MSRHQYRAKHRYVNRPATPAEQLDMGVEAIKVNCVICQDRVDGCPHCPVERIKADTK